MTSSDGPRIPTQVAYAGFEEHGFRGFRLYGELAGHQTMSGMLGLALRGSPFTEDERGMLDDLGTIVTVAEPRIWPLKLSRIVASYGRSFVGYAAGNLALDGALIGVAGCGAAARRIEDTRGVLERGETIVVDGRVIGFGVPFRDTDERVVNLTRAVEKRGRDDAIYWTAFLRLAEAVEAARGLKPNIGAALSAVALDLGLRPNQVSLFALALASNCFFANVQEAADQRAELLKRIPDEYVEYCGPAPRISPKKVR